MASTWVTALRAAGAGFALSIAGLLAACNGIGGGSPPHEAPANPAAEASENTVELTWNAVPDASRYVIKWFDVDATPDAPFSNEITDLTDTHFTHTSLVNFHTYRYRIVAETKGGRGPESLIVSAVPGPVPGPVEWTVVTSENPGQTIHFATADRATRYRVYFAGTEASLAGRRPATLFEETNH